MAKWSYKIIKDIDYVDVSESCVSENLVSGVEGARSLSCGMSGVMPMRERQGGRKRIAMRDRADWRWRCVPAITGM